MQWHSIVLEARFAQWAAALQPGAMTSHSPGAALDGVSRQAHMALRGFAALTQRIDALAIGEQGEASPAAMALQNEIARVGRSAARLARRLMQVQAAAAGRRVDGVALAQGIRGLGIEVGQPLDPVAIAAAVRGVLDGTAPLGTADAAAADTGAALAKLFAQIALVALLARHVTA